MTKPRIIKTDGRWTVHINGRAWNTRRTWEDALHHANRITRFSHQIRMRLDIKRIQEVLDRMEGR